MINNYCPRCGKPTNTAGQCDDWNCGIYANSKPREIDEEKVKKIIGDCFDNFIFMFADKQQREIYEKSIIPLLANEIATSDIWKEEKR